MTVLIAGGGIAGLTLGLTLHQIGVPFRIFEAAPAIRPLGVGVNLQPNAVRELYALGLEDALEEIGLRTQEYGFYSKHGLEIWTEPRGLWAGYKWPQYSIHRGALQLLLYETLLARAGPDCVATGWRATGFENHGEGVRLALSSTTDGAASVAEGRLLFGADGIHSAIRAQIVPDEGPPIWNGAVLWRATSRAQPFRGGASMALIGHATQRFVAYPISKPDPADGHAVMNWIAELKFDPSGGWSRPDWSRAADRADFAPKFADWRFDWIDIPALIAGAAEVFEYPMADRDPLERWRDGRVSLIGDAAHATYPVGSNGASQAIIDARVIGAALVAHGVGVEALEAYEAQMLPAMRRIILANRGSGPDAILQQVEDLCGGAFERIEDVIPHGELAAHAAKYKAVAGFSIEELNARPPILAPGAQVARG